MKGRRVLLVFLFHIIVTIISSRTKHSHKSNIKKETIKSGQKLNQKSKQRSPKHPTNSSNKHIHRRNESENIHIHSNSSSSSSSIEIYKKSSHYTRISTFSYYVGSQDVLLLKSIFNVNTNLSEIPNLLFYYHHQEGKNGPTRLHPHDQSDIYVLNRFGNVSNHRHHNLTKNNENDDKLLNQRYNLSVALIYWGLCRSTDHTLNSTMKYIYEPLQRAGIKYDIYLHTFLINHTYINHRSHEENITLNNELYKLLQPTVCKLENQDDFDRSINCSAYYSHRDPWHNNYTSSQNYLRGLYSMYEATKLFLESNKTYDRVIFLRPDVKFYHPLHVYDWIVNITDHEVILPDFANYPINDRFAICQPNVAKLIGLRYQYAFNYSQHYTLHSERFLYDLIETNRILIHKIDFFFHRMRSSGRIEMVDLQLDPFVT